MHNPALIPLVLLAGLGGLLYSIPYIRSKSSEGENVKIGLALIGTVMGFRALRTLFEFFHQESIELLLVYAQPLSFAGVGAVILYTTTKTLTKNQAVSNFSLLSFIALGIIAASSSIAPGFVSGPEGFWGREWVMAKETPESMVMLALIAISSIAVLFLAYKSFTQGSGVEKMESIAMLLFFASVYLSAGFLSVLDATPLLVSASYAVGGLLLVYQKPPTNP